MFVHWALDKRTPVQAGENGAKPELLSFTKTSFILFWTFTVETCKLILLAVVNFIRYGSLNKINFRRAPPGAGRPPGGALQPPPSRPRPAPVGGGGGGHRHGLAVPPVPGLCPRHTPAAEAPRPGGRTPSQKSRDRRSGSGAERRAGERRGGAAGSEAAPKVSRLVRCHRPAACEGVRAAD